MSLYNTNTDILIAGAFAAFTVDLLVYPLDTIKTRMQSPQYKTLYTTSSGSLNRSLFRGLYQGIGSVILATVPSSGAFFTTYEGTRAALYRLNSQKSGEKCEPDRNPGPLPGPVINSLASATGEVVSCLILTPAEVLKQNAQVVQRSKGHSSNIFDRNATIQAMRKFNSPTQLWRGYTALVARNLPFTAMQFPMFEHFKVTILDWRRRRGQSSSSLLEKGVITSLAAGTSGSIAAVVTTPIDVVKTRIMLSAASDGNEDMKQKRHALEKEGKVNLETIKKGRMGSWAVGKEILKTEGVRVLFTGGALRAVWTFLGSGLYLGVYESGRTYLERRRTVRED